MTYTITPRDIVEMDEHGIVTPTLVEAVEYARGGNVLKYPAPELAEPKHAISLLTFAGRLHEGVSRPMTRLHVAPVLRSFVVLEVSLGWPMCAFPPLFATHENALAFMAWLESYRESSILWPPVDLQMEIAAGLAEFYKKLREVDLGAILAPTEVLRAFLDSDAGREALRRCVHE
jgi:hypothetical protein